jgi:hypothetical protein
MKVGDKKKATILGVVAVCAIAFLVIRAVPPQGPRTARVAPAFVAAMPTASDGQVAPTQSALLNDPFSHPALGEKKAPDPQGPTPKDGTSDGPQTLPNATISPLNLQGATIQVSKDPDRPNPKPPPPAGSAAGAAPRASAKGATSFVVSAVLIAGRPCAFISINGRPSVPIGLGQRLSKDLPYQVTVITNDGIWLAGRNKSIWISVGMKANL